MQKEFVINWHITEACNYACQFCFAHWDQSKKRDIIKNETAAHDLIDQLVEMFERILVKKWGFEQLRINFAGGEPLLYRTQLLKIASYCQSKGIKTSLITNGVYLLEHQPNLSMFDMLGVSIDSLDQVTNRRIGRRNRQNEVLDAEGLQNYLQSLQQSQPHLDIKINTVVNAENWQENMNAFIGAVAPKKWKVFKMLPILTDQLSVSHDEFEAFLVRHTEHHDIVVAENNDAMTSSYLMVDPMGRFYSNAQSQQISAGYQYSSVIIDVGAEQAFNEIEFEIDKFNARY